jgi:hypothetical protein
MKIVVATASLSQERFSPVWSHFDRSIKGLFKPFQVDAFHDVCEEIEQRKNDSTQHKNW